MQIDRIEPFDKTKYHIYIDGRLAFVLYKGELRRLNLREGMEISDEIYKLINEDILPKRAMKRCMFLLDKRDYTEYELRGKLIRAYYPTAAIDYAIDKLRMCGFIDDMRYAERYFVYKSGTKSIRRIKNDLIGKGIDRSVIDAAYDQASGKGELGDEDELIHRLLVKRHYYEHDITAAEYAKQRNYLLSKGFSYDSVNRALHLT